MAIRRNQNAGTEVDAMNRSGRFPASHYDRHGLRIRRALPLPLRERGHGPRERMRSAPRGRRVRTMPTAKSEKREAARGISEVERPFAKRTFLARPERPAAVDGRPSVFRRGERAADAAYSASDFLGMPARALGVATPGGCGRSCPGKSSLRLCE